MESVRNAIIAGNTIVINTESVPGDCAYLLLLLYSTGICHQVTSNDQSGDHHGLVSPVDDGLKVPMELTLRTGENSQLIVVCVANAGTNLVHR